MPTIPATTPHISDPHTHTPNLSTELVCYSLCFSLPPIKLHLPCEISPRTHFQNIGYYLKHQENIMMVVCWGFTCLQYLRWCQDECCLVTGGITTPMTDPCDSAHSWRLYSASKLGEQAIDIMIKYPTQSHYSDNMQSSPCPILLIH